MWACLSGMLTTCKYSNYCVNTIDLFWHPIRLYSDQAATASSHDDTSRAAGHTFCTHALCADEDMHGWYTIAISQLVIAMHVLHMYVCAIFPDACIYRSQCTTWSKYANKGTSICGTWESGGAEFFYIYLFLENYCRFVRDEFLR